MAGNCWKQKHHRRLEFRPKVTPPATPPGGTHPGRASRVLDGPPTPQLPATLPPDGVRTTSYLQPLIPPCRPVQHCFSPAQQPHRASPARPSTQQPSSYSAEDHLIQQLNTSQIKLKLSHHHPPISSNSAATHQRLISDSSATHQQLSSDSVTTQQRLSSNSSATQQQLSSKSATSHQQLDNNSAAPNLANSCLGSHLSPAPTQHLRLPLSSP